MATLLLILVMCASDDATKADATIPEEILAYLKAADVQQLELIDVLQKEEIKLNKALKQSKGTQFSEISSRLDKISVELKRQTKPPAIFRFPGIPAVGAIGYFDEISVISTLDGTDLVLAQVKYIKEKGITPKVPHQNEVVNFVLVSNAIRDKPDSVPMLKPTSLFRAVRVERDSSLADSAIAKIPQSQLKATLPRIDSIVVVESIATSVVESYREEFEKNKPKSDVLPSTKSNQIPAEILVYLKAEDAYRDELIDVLQREVARLKIVYSKSSTSKKPGVVASTKIVLDEIKRIEQMPIRYRFPGVPPVGTLGHLDESSVISGFDGTDLVLVKVKHSKVKSVGPKNPLEDEVLSYVLISGLPREKPESLPTLKANALYRAVRVERDTPFAESAIAKIPPPSQATISRRTSVAIRSLVVLEPVESSTVDVHREQYQRVRSKK